MCTPQENAIVQVPEGFELLINKLSEDTDKLLLEIDYKITNDKFLDNLVR